MRTILGCLLLTGTTAALAAPPDVKTVFPPGGQRGTTVTVTLGGTTGTAPSSVWCSRADLKIEPAKEAGKFQVSIPADAAPGRCWLRWTNAEGASAQKPFVVGALPEVEDKEPNNDLAKAQRLENSRVVVNGILEKSGEVDVFAVTLKKGETLVAWLDANDLLGSPMDGSLQILSPKGFVCVQNDDDHGLDPLATYTAEADGVHYVRLFAFPAATNSSVVFFGSPDSLYRLTLSTGPFVDYSLPLAVAQESPQPVRLFGWNLPSDAGPVTPTAIPGDDGARLLTSPDVDNLRRLPVVSHAVVTEPEARTDESVLPVTLPVTLSGRIAARKEKDRYSFPAKKGERWSIRMEARGLGSPLDPAVRVRDASGKALLEMDDTPKKNPDPELLFTAPADGEYQLEIRDLYDDGGARYFYRATLEPAQAEANVTLAADAFVLPADKPLEIPVTIERLAGFKETLEISVAGLPEGLKAAAVSSQMTDATAKLVNLKIERVPGAAKLPAGAAFRVVARTMAAPSASSATPVPASPDRFADAPIVGQTVRTTDFWLSIAPMP